MLRLRKKVVIWGKEKSLLNNMAVNKIDFQALSIEQKYINTQYAPVLLCDVVERLHSEGGL